MPRSAMAARATASISERSGSLAARLATSTLPPRLANACCKGSNGRSVPTASEKPADQVWALMCSKLMLNKALPPDRGWNAR